MCIRDRPAGRPAASGSAPALVLRDVMGAVDLRPYQEEARRAVEREWDEGRAKTLLVLPTGCGKTIVFAMVAKDVVDGGGRVLVLAHRGELHDPAADKSGKATGLGCSVEKAERTSVGEWGAPRRSSSSPPGAARPSLSLIHISEPTRPY